MDFIPLVLVAVGGVLGAIEVVRSRAQSLLAWGVTAIAVALLLAFAPKAL